MNTCCKIPRVSVVIPAHNVTGYIAGAIESVLAQTFPFFECIVVNDGCPDTEALEQVLVPYEGRIRYIKQSNRGLSGARNSGLRAARGELVAFLDADDVWAPDFLLRQVAYIDEHPNICVLWSDARVIGDTPASGRLLSELNSTGGPATVEGILTEKCVPFVSFTIMRKASLVACGGFDETLRRAEDYDVWIRMAQRGTKFRFRPAVLGSYRVHSGSLSSNVVEQHLAGIKVCRNLLARVDSKDPIVQIAERQIRRIKGRIAQHLAVVHISEGDYKRAMQAFRKGNALDWSLSRTVLILLLHLSPRLALAVRRMNRWRVSLSCRLKG